MNYNEFLLNKTFVLESHGFDVSPDELNKNLFGFQADITRWALAKGRAAVFSDCGSGKGQPYGSRVLTPNGWKKIEDLKVGDSIISSDGNPHTVTGVYPKGELDTYRFYYSDGISCVFDVDHLHIVRTNNDRQRGKPWRVMSTTELLNSKLRYGNDEKSRNYDIPVVKPVSFSRREHFISPYILGNLLSDGCLNQSIVSTIADAEVRDRIIAEIPEGVTLKQKDDISYSFQSPHEKGRNTPSIFRKELIRMDLCNKHSYEKFIPEEYLFDSVENRLDLVRGMMDGDGYMESTCVYYTTSERLKSDFIFLIQSLGGIPTCSVKKGKCKKNGETIECRDCYCIYFSLNTFNPCYLSRKADKWNNNPRDNGRWIDRIEYEKKQRTVCISVDSPDHSYVTENMIVTHNTVIQLEWANQIAHRTGGKVLIVAPLAVTEQTRREGEKFGIPVKVCASQDDVEDGISVTNYEKLDHFVASEFVGVVLDESSILKSFTGKIRNQIITNFAKTPYKLACTATPAPNDFMELGNHSEFLGVMTRPEMLSMFFVHDGGQTSKWRLKGHAEDLYWQWMASWAVFMDNPKTLGYDDEGYDLPELRIYETIVDGDVPVTETLTLSQRRDARRDSLDLRCQAAADIVNNSGEQWVVWCDLNCESELLHKLIPDSTEIRGSDKPESKTKAVLDFADGSIRCLVSKSSIYGFGCNMQHCHNMIFVGLSDSYEQYYQAVRRCWRFGQDKPVNVHIIISKNEGCVKANIERKEQESERMKSEMVKYTKDITKKELRKTCRLSTPYDPTVKFMLPAWNEFAA